MATMSPARKRIAMLIVAIGSGLLVERVVALASDDVEISGPVQARRSRAGEADKPITGEAVDSSATAGSVQLDRLEARQRAGQDTAKPTAPHASQPALFDTVSWLPPPPKAVASPPPQPVAPPFPYAYMGGLSEDGVRTSFFMQGDRVLPVKAGDTIDATYRIDQMTDKQMTLTYLPLNETLVVALGAPGAGR